MTENDGARSVLGPLEAEVMEILWQTDTSMSVRDVLVDLNRERDEPLAYTTVMTVMARLADKGVLERELQGRGYIYRAVASDPAAIAVRRLVRDFGESALAHFVEEARADPKLLRRLTALLDDEK